jgi:LacI family transcriptional regulator
MADTPTMNDVARVADVGLKTVSRYVNGATNIDPVLAARIAEAIKTLGYRRNLAAASIRPGWTSKVLGLIISDLANPYYSALTRSIESYARSRGYLLISASSDEDGDRHDELVDRLLEQRVDGLLIVPPRKEARAWGLVPTPIPPVVFLDRPLEFEHADVILADNAGGARTATQTLLGGGARRIAFVGDARSIYTMRERYSGYLNALRGEGIAEDPALVRDDAHSSEQATSAVRDLLASTDADAIFAANNRASVGALLAFRETGRRVPLIGFDDFEAATLSSPAVSVISQDVAAMGRRAAQLLIDRLGGWAGERVVETLPVSLVLRGSEVA